MKVLAVTCYTGGEELVEMTEQTLQQLRSTAPPSATLHVCSTAQGAARIIETEGRWAWSFKNEGFAAGMNASIEEGVDFFGAPDYVLCFNNDLEFPHRNWLQVLLDAATPSFITVPATDKTALHKQPGPLPRPSFRTEEASAYCWLVPFAWCEHLKQRHGWWLFDPAFFAYGEDNWTAFLLSKAFGPKIFRMVPRSFVRHLRHQTSRHVKLSRTQSNRLLVDRLAAELKDPKLRPDLRRRAERYIAILSRRA